MSEVADKIQRAVAKSHKPNTKILFRALLMRVADFAYTGMSGMQIYEYMEKYLEENFDYEE